MATRNGKAKFKIRIKGFETKPARAFQFNPLNYRRHGEDQRAALRTMLGDVGWVQGVIENKRTGNLIDGHARIEEALRDDPDQAVPYLVVDLSPAEEKAVLATLDPIGAMAEVDPELLDQLYQQTIAGMPGLEELLTSLHYENGAGANGDDLQDGNVAVERAAALKKKWKVKARDLWSIGAHRLLCGDATAAADVRRLVGRARPALMITDPPYGVDYDAGWRVNTVNHQGALAGELGKGLAPVTNDERSGWRAAFELAPSSIAYVWHASAGAGAVQFATDLAGAGFTIRNQIIWRKPNFVISRGHYHWQHEPCWYAVRKGQQSDWLGDHSQTTVWDIASLQPMGRSQDQDDQATGHSTQKPLECMARPMRNHAGDVYDPFLGSGTTMVAAQHLGRRCYALEIDPGFVAVTLERMRAAFPDLQIAKVGP